MKIYTKEMIKERNNRKAKILKLLRIVFMPIIISILILAGYIAYHKFILKESNVEIFGYRAYIVLTGSMKSNINPGDVVIVKKINPEEIKVGDIITFSLKNDEATVTHRVAREENKEGTRRFITKGDNNNAEDIDPVSYEQIKGILIKKISKMGYIVTELLTGTGLIVMVVIIILSYVHSTHKEDRMLAREDARKKYNVCKYKSE